MDKLKSFFNLPDDKIAVDESLTGYIVSAKFYNMPEDQRIILFKKIINDNTIPCGVMLLDLQEAEYVEIMK